MHQSRKAAWSDPVKKIEIPEQLVGNLTSCSSLRQLQALCSKWNSHQADNSRRRNNHPNHNNSIPIITYAAYNKKSHPLNSISDRACAKRRSLRNHSWLNHSDNAMTMKARQSSWNVTVNLFEM